MGLNFMASFQTKEWLRAGYGDLRNIGYIVHDEFLTHMVAFHAQQTVEKTLKAIIEHEENRIPRVHKLQNLIGRIELTIEVDEGIVEILDELYIDSRYPGDIGLLPHGKPTLHDAKEFQEFAQNIFDEVCSALEVDTNELMG